MNELIPNLLFENTLSSMFLIVPPIHIRNPIMIISAVELLVPPST
jgi:hypothetical protein